MIYEPREDSLLLQKYVKRYVKKGDKVLDMGTGSGIQAITAFEITKNITAVDINKQCVNNIKKQYPAIKAFQSDLFSNIPKKEAFNLIIFNPPYLPEEKRATFEERTVLSGGKYGHELLERFFRQAKQYLKPKGKILVVFSSLTGDIKEKIQSLGYVMTQLAEESFFFEKIGVYCISMK